MVSDYDNSLHADHLLAPPQHLTDYDPHVADPRYQNGGHHTPDLHANSRTPVPAGSPAQSDRDWSETRRPSGDSIATRQRSGRSGSGQIRTCKKCGLPLTGQFVRALDGTFHLDCFRCRDCGQIVASKFFPSEDENGEGQYPLCETDYFRRLGLLCYQCGGALRGSYITALDRKYHVNHFTCSVCPAEFGAQDSYYEHQGQVYCHYHYSTQFAQRCNGCRTAILKQFVEIFRNGQNQHWHPECYMIHKFWNVRLAHPDDTDASGTPAKELELAHHEEEKMDDKVYRIWSVLSAFEESSAACISDMLLHVSNGAYVEGIIVAKRFIFHVEILFGAADDLDANATETNANNLSYGREAKLLCKKIVAFFSLVSKAQDTGARKLGVTQDLLSLVTGLAHYLKLLIRICLQGALRIERESRSSDCVHLFLTDLEKLEAIKDEIESLGLTSANQRLSAKDSDHCATCDKSLEDECAKLRDLRWHIPCLGCITCSRELGRTLQDAHYNSFDSKVYCKSCVSVTSEAVVAFEHVTKLQQYVYLLRVAMARLMDRLQRSGAIPHTTDDPNLNGYNATDGQRAGGGRDPQGADAKARSHNDHRRESSYEMTRDEVAKLRNTRLDRSLSSSVRKARMSRIMDRPEGRSVRPGSAGADDGGRGNNSLQIVEDRDVSTTDMMFGHQEGLTLDDIPRIVAAEQVKERFNGPSRQEYGPGQQRPSSAGRDGELAHIMTGARPGRRFFSELSSLEYFTVRHLAVLWMHPMVDSEFTQEELLGFIEQRKPATFWKNLGKAFGKNERKPPIKKKGVFGVPLEIILERDGADSTDGVGPGALRIPAIVDNIISAMKQMDLSVEGVFRKNGNIKKQHELADKIDREGCDNISFMEQPVVQIAALLKRYLRELPDPLMTNKLFRLWIAAAKIPDPVRRKECLHLACCLLPKSHRDCLEILLRFLKWAGSFHQVDEESGSRMDIRNLATVIAPNILYNPAKINALDNEPLFAIDAVDDLITYIEEMCMVPSYLESILSDAALFSASGEITTKEILKRFQELHGQRPQGDTGEMFAVRQEGSTRPPARRVETDPAGWQGEVSVRPVIQDSTPSTTPAPGPAIAPPPAAPAPTYQAYTPYTSLVNPAPSAPGANWNRPDAAGTIPHAMHFDNHAEPQPIAVPDGNHRHEWRNSNPNPTPNWSRQNSSGLGVTGSS